MLVRVLVVAPQQAVFTEDCRPQAVEGGQQGLVLEFVRRGEIHRQAGFPRLGAALGVVQQAGIGVEMIEVVPAVLKVADRGRVFIGQHHPLLVVLLGAEQLAEVLLGIPVPQFGAIEQHHAGGDLVALFRFSGTMATHHCRATHVPVEQFVDVANGEHVGVCNNRPTLPVHQRRRHKAQRCEGLQVIHVPDPGRAATQERLPLPRRQEGVIAGMDKTHVKLVGLAGIAAEGVLGHQRTQPLALICMNEYALVHGNYFSAAV